MLCCGQFGQRSNPDGGIRSAIGHVLKAGARKILEQNAREVTRATHTGSPSGAGGNSGDRVVLVDVFRRHLVTRHEQSWMPMPRFRNGQGLLNIDIKG
jgi:hypothetical protein